MQHFQSYTFDLSLNFKVSSILLRYSETNVFLIFVVWFFHWLTFTTFCLYFNKKFIRFIITKADGGKRIHLVRYSVSYAWGSIFTIPTCICTLFPICVKINFWNILYSFPLASEYLWNNLGKHYSSSLRLTKFQSALRKVTWRDLF